MSEARYITEQQGRRHPPKPCQKCGKPFVAGDRVVSRSKRRREEGRGRGSGLSRNYYHEDCWEKLFL